MCARSREQRVIGQSKMINRKCQQLTLSGMWLDVSIFTYTIVPLINTTNTLTGVLLKILPLYLPLQVHLQEQEPMQE